MKYIGPIYQMNLRWCSGSETMCSVVEKEKRKTVITHLFKTVYICYLYLTFWKVDDNYDMCNRVTSVV